MDHSFNINDVALRVILQTIKEKGLTEKSVLLEAGVSTSFLTDWKKRRIISPSFDKVYRIGKTLQLNLDSLQDYENEDFVNNKPISEGIPVDEKILLDTYRELNQAGKSLLQTNLREIWKTYQL